MNIFDNIFSGSNGIANKLIDIFGTEAYYVRSNNHKTYDLKTDTYTNNEEIKNYPSKERAGMKNVHIAKPGDDKIYSASTSH